MFPWRLWLCLLALGLTALPAMAQRPAAPRLTYVKVDSRPAAAEIYDRNYSAADPTHSALGKTPLTLPLDRNSSHTLWLVRDGYQVERLVVPVVAPGAPVPHTDTVALTLTPTRIDTWLLRHPETLVVALLLGMGGFAWNKLRFRRLETQLVDALLRDPDMIGRVVGGYRIVAALGEGGFSSVYRVESVEFGDTYALKLLKAEALSPIAVERFYLEMELGRDLRHPGLARVWAFGTYETRPYLVMDYVKGRTLSEVQTRLSQVELLELFVKICLAVQALHERGLVHRDLKPDNIMVLQDLSIKVLDFGAVKHMNRKGLTVTGTTLGTPLFMSPEHLDAKGVDQRSDVYSAGVVLYFLLTGRTPFDGESTMEVLLAHLDQAPPQMINLTGQFSPELEAIMQRMLAKSPSARYPTMAAVVTDLNPVVEGLKAVQSV